MLHPYPQSVSLQLSLSLSSPRLFLCRYFSLCLSVCLAISVSHSLSISLHLNPLSLPLLPSPFPPNDRSPGYRVWVELLFRVGFTEELDSHHSEDVDDHAEHKREVTQSSQRTEDDGEQHAHRGPSLRQAEDTEQTQLNKKRDSVTTMN